MRFSRLTVLLACPLYFLVACASHSGDASCDNCFGGGGQHAGAGYGGVAPSAGAGGVTNASGSAGTVGASGAAGSANAGSGGMAGASGTAGTSGAAGSANAGSSGTAGSGGVSALPPVMNLLCVFDYDLTLSTHLCDSDRSACRTNACMTYNWKDQCVSDGARRAIAQCVERGAFIGIASHSPVDSCWNDKVAPIVSENQFPELTSSPRYGNTSHDFDYPALDNRANWNCADCAYQMDPTHSKPELIAKVMAHYGMDPNSGTDRARVIFWDDTVQNISDTNQQMPEVKAILVPQNIQGSPNSGGCGITDAQISAGWQNFTGL